MKNQLRKRETVAVCIAQPPSEVEREMNLRGVAPDLLRRDLSIPPSHNAFALEANAEAPIIPQDASAKVDLSKIPALVTWRVDSALPKDLALLDEIALDCLDAGANARSGTATWKSRRWLHLSPRYLGRLAQNLRLLDSNREFAARFIEAVDKRVKSGAIAATVEIHSYIRGTQNMYRLAPTAR